MDAPSAVVAVIGLTGVPTPMLEQLLRLVHRGEVACPLTPLALAFAGAQSYSERILDATRGLDAASVRAVLVCVLAERKRARIG